MRLGVVNSPDSAVALSMAIDSREVVIVLNNSSVPEGANDLLFSTTKGEDLVVAIDNSGLPVTGKTSKLKLDFQNAGVSDVQVTVTEGNTQLGSVISPLPISKLPRSFQKMGPAKAAGSQSELIERVIIGLRTFGCAGRNALEQLGVSTDAAGPTADTCQSVLLDAAQEVADNNSYDDLPQSELPDNPACGAANSGSLGAAGSCLNTVGASLVNVVLSETPDIDAGVTGETDPRDEINADGSKAEEEEESFLLPFDRDSRPGGNDDEDFSPEDYLEEYERFLNDSDNELSDENPFDGWTENTELEEIFPDGSEGENVDPTDPSNPDIGDPDPETPTEPESEEPGDGEEIPPLETPNPPGNPTPVDPSDPTGQQPPSPPSAPIDDEG